ncbi:hypothetical protein [Chitinophaga pinensis]|uniref:Cell shape-determining protein MreB n=1 Tax=Chitinophaga pinensis (strain ATCC 43595 / DSM 2588 / LMG 13176 / NBRC 15968 / NCIMB 11800 / UQM 2034) TaxID=485918 RepID=A0A979FYW8_CHIPD|nr:hypothetical protein [Chitinophaga pinensis]ACU57676.1 conserved hypothetical protein [Chitinophaga pinensis DSM 2588]
MRKNKTSVLLMAAALATTFVACKDDDKVEPTPEQPKATVELKGKISADRKLSKDTFYLMKEYVYVTNNATLTIEPGTTILGGNTSPTSGGTLIITAGAKLIAKGTADAPIVFTSAKAPGARAKGDWGGIILLGKGSTNRPVDKRVVEGLANVDATVNLNYGNAASTQGDDADNSGVLQYVRIEFGGIALASTADSEVNGVTFYAVGSGTTVDHIQVSYSGDDAYEWFGGSVNCKYLVAYGTLDDNFDMDSGFKGKLQFLVALLDPKASDVVSLSNGLEVDNLNGANTSTPFTHPIISNLTLVGPGAATGAGDYFYSGARWRRGANFTVANSVFSGMPVATDVESKVAQDYLSDGTSKITNSIFQASGISPISTQRGAGATAIGPVLFDADTKDASYLTGNDIKNLIMAEANTNTTYTALADVFAKVPSAASYKATNTEFALKTAKTAVFSAEFDAFFDKVNYVGAVDPANPWTNQAWINWTPNETVYVKE